MKFLDRFYRLSPREVLLAGVAIVAGVGVIDYATGPEFGLSIFYLIPICAASWLAGRRVGILLAFSSAATWLIAELLWHVAYVHSIVPFWNAVVRLGLFAVSGALTAEVARRRRVEEALRNQTDILESILNSMGDGVIVADGSGKIILFNPAAERLLKTKLANVSPEIWLKEQETYLPDKLTAYPSHDHPLLRAIAGQSVDGAEMCLRRTDDHEPEVWLSVTSRPLMDSSGLRKGGVMVFSDITQRRNLEKQIADVSDREQRRIGQDIHDGLCQQLVSTAFAATLLRDKLEEMRLSEASSADGISDMINESITQARTLARGLYPVTLEVDGLVSALDHLADSVESLTQIRCEFLGEDSIVVHDKIAAANLYRIAQEAVNNAVKHSRAKQIRIELESVEDELTLTVSDNGVGFPPEPRRTNGMGLSIMNYRARLIGAALDIRRGTHGGTNVICSLRNVNSTNTPS